MNSSRTPTIFLIHLRKCEFCRAPSFGLPFFHSVLVPNVITPFPLLPPLSVASSRLRAGCSPFLFSRAPVLENPLCSVQSWSKAVFFFGFQFPPLPWYGHALSCPKGLLGISFSLPVLLPGVITGASLSRFFSSLVARPGSSPQLVFSPTCAAPSLMRAKTVRSFFVVDFFLHDHGPCASSFAHEKDRDSDLSLFFLPVMQIPSSKPLPFMSRSRSG